MLRQAFLIWLRHTLHPWIASPRKLELRRLNAGQGLVEYALIIILVGIVVMAIMIMLGPAISNMYRNIVAQF